MSASKTGSSAIFTAAGTTRSRTEGIDSGLRSPVPGFGMNTRRDGNGRYRPSLSSAASSPRSRVTPYSSASARRDTVNARRAAVAAHVLPRPVQHIPAVDLSNSAWNRLLGSALAAR